MMRPIRDIRRLHELVVLESQLHEQRMDRRSASACPTDGEVLLIDEAPRIRSVW
jgi:hypothetical protein